MARKSTGKKVRRHGLDVDYADLAQIVHETVSRYTRSDGATWCLGYAICATARLNAVTRLTHTIVGGRLIVPRLEAEFDHFWTLRSTPGYYTYIDFATRHNPTLTVTESSRCAARSLPISAWTLSPFRSTSARGRTSAGRGSIAGTRS